MMHRNVGEIHGGNLEHVSCTLCVGFSDKRCVKVYEAFALEERMDSESHGISDTENRSECVCTESHVCHSSQIFQRCVFLLERIFHRIALTVDFDGVSLDLHMLSASDGFYEMSFYAETGSGGDSLEQIFTELLGFSHYLDIIDSGAIVKCYEFYLFISSFGPYPTFGKHLLSRLHIQQLFDFSPYKCFHLYEIRYFSKDKQLCALYKKSDPEIGVAFKILLLGTYSALRA